MRAVGKGRPMASGRLYLRRTLTHGGRSRDVGVGVFGVAEILRKAKQEQPGNSAVYPMGRRYVPGEAFWEARGGGFIWNLRE